MFSRPAIGRPPGEPFPAHHDPTSMNVAVFDFDKTIVSIDSFRLFSFLASRGWSDYGIASLSALACGLRLIDNDRYKRVVLGSVWRRRPDREKKTILQTLEHKLRQSLNPAVVDALEGHLGSNEPVLVISASPQFYVEPFVSALWRGTTVCASQFCENGDRLPARNVYGEKKVEYVREFIKRNRAKRVAVYTDSISDLPIVQLADEVRLVGPSREFQRRLRKLHKQFEVIC